MRIHYEVEGTIQTIHAVEKVERGVVDFRQLGVWDAVQNVFYQIEKEQFESGGSGQTGRWEPLSKDYAVAKTKKYRGPTRVLIASGRGYRSLTGPGGDAVVDKKAGEMTLGSSLPYMKHHQTGTRKMPARKPIDFTDEQRLRLFAPISKKLRQLIDNAKLRDIRGF